VLSELSSNIFCFVARTGRESNTVADLSTPIQWYNVFGLVLKPCTIKTDKICCGLSRERVGYLWMVLIHLLP